MWLNYCTLVISSQDNLVPMTPFATFFLSAFNDYSLLITFKGISEAYGVKYCIIVFSLLTKNL